MNIYISADHNGFELKNYLSKWLESEGYRVEDMGAKDFDEKDDYPDYGMKVAKAVAEDPDNRFGITICGSGVGMSVVAGKVPGIRAGLIHNPSIARAARADDDINVLALGADFIERDRAKEVVKAWLEAEFSGKERHIRRIDKIKAYEKTCNCA